MLLSAFLSSRAERYFRLNNNSTRKLRRKRAKKALSAWTRPTYPAIGIYKPPDVRPILKAYQGKNIPIEYAKKEAEAKGQFIEDWKKSGKATISTGSFTLTYEGRVRP
ncbi:TIM50_1 [Sanghuangporus weigelae]